jgi:hypothetical protein
MNSVEKFQLGTMVSVSGELGEGLNNLMHAMLKEKLMPLETVVSIKQVLSLYYSNEIKRGMLTYKIRII